MYKLYSLLAVTSLLLGGCVLGPGTGDGSVVGGPKGNGEGYGGNREPVVRTFYQVDPQAQCDGTTIGYRGKIEERADGTFEFTEACGTAAPKPLATAELDQLDHKLVGYGAGIYERRETPPTAADTGTFLVAWCHTVQGPPQGFLLGRRTNASQLGASVYQVEDNSVTFTDPFAVAVRLEDPLRWVLSEPLQAVVRISPEAVERNRYPGWMRFEGETRGVLCRAVAHYLDPQR